MHLYIPDYIKFTRQKKVRWWKKLRREIKEQCDTLADITLPISWDEIDIMSHNEWFIHFHFPDYLPLKKHTKWWPFGMYAWHPLTKIRHWMKILIFQEIQKVCKKRYAFYIKSWHTSKFVIWFMFNPNYFLSTQIFLYRTSAWKKFLNYHNNPKRVENLWILKTSKQFEYFEIDDIDEFDITENEYKYYQKYYWKYLIQKNILKDDDEYIYNANRWKIIIWIL